jgi:hypothetical protein
MAWLGFGRQPGFAWEGWASQGHLRAPAAHGLGLGSSRPIGTHTNGLLLQAAAARGTGYWPLDAQHGQPKNSLRAWHALPCAI